jgi:CheY-like chemotaxis protein
MAKLKILVVDDAAFIRDLVKKAVKETYPGCDLYEAIDGRKAISIMNGQDIGVVLCDWEMPEMSGIEVLQWMRADERYKAIPFMMITSRGDRDHVVKAVEAGVSDYIGKPFTRENFVSKLSKMVFKHHKIRPNAPERQHATGLGGDSANVLAAASAKPNPQNAQPAAQTNSKPTAQTNSKPAAQDMGGASVLMGNSKSAKVVDEAAPAAAKKPAARAKGVVSVRFGSGGTAKLVIKDINLQEMIGVFRRDGALPALLEPVVLDIVDKEGGDVARINGYVRMMQAQEPHPDAETIQMLIRYVDDDQEKLDILSRYIASVR